jgi:type I restriction enzyme S subunit
MKRFKSIKSEVIPKEWKIVRLREIVDNDQGIVAGPFGSNLKVSDYRPKGIPIIRLQNIEKNRFINKDIKFISFEKAKELSYHSYKPGDLVLAKLGDPIGKTCIVPFSMEEGIVVADVVRIRLSKAKASTQFVEYMLNSNTCLIQLKKETIGSTRPRVNITQVRNMQLPLPSLPEQQKIAEILTAVDESIEKTDQAIDKTQGLKKGLMQELLTKGIGHKEFEDKEIGRLPKEWEVVIISDIADVKGGKRIPKGHALVDSKTPYPYLRVVDFKNMTINSAAIKYVPAAAHELIKRYVISSNDVYISIAGTIGLVGLIPKEFNGANLTENAAKLCNLRNVTKEFLAYVLSSFIAQNQISALVGKAQQPKLALFRIEKIKVPRPPLPEQKKIAEILSTVDMRLELLTMRRERLEMVKEGLMNDLLTGKKRVNLE